MIELIDKTASDEYLDFEAFIEALDRSHPNIHMLLGAGTGMSGEIGEFEEILKKHVWQKKAFDEVHAKKELADILWYYLLACKALDTTIEEIYEILDNKLMSRYEQTNGRFSLEANENRKANDV